MKLLTLTALALSWTPGLGEETTQQQLEKLEGAFKQLVRQVQVQQVYLDQKIRTEGSSGIKVARRTRNGPANYYTDTHVSRTVAAVHDHADFRGTMGMGESEVVLNGVEFRTRHLDYKLVMPSTRSKQLDAVEEIPWPDVPPEVLAKKNVTEQVKEMIEWFRAFDKQDHSVRDYRKYFKPVLCYLEGGWTLDKELVEPFQSDRHHLEANSWRELMETMIFNTYTGIKNNDENDSFQPTTILSIDKETGLPNYAQWNYRALCKPTPMDIPTRYFKQVDDMSYRYPRGMDLKSVKNKRSARFVLSDQYPRFEDWTMLDDIMYSIPGKDNIPANLTELGKELFRIDQPDLVRLNTGYYHRWFKFTKPGAMGTNKIARGFNDEYLFVAQTTQRRIAGIDREHCEAVMNPKKGQPKRQCTTYPTKFTYAIPLEVVYLNPLRKWNPYKIRYLGKNVGAARKNGRDGRTPKTAFSGSFTRGNYQTPAEFFSAGGERGPADTAKDFMWVQGGDGKPRAVSATGPRIIMPDIGDIKGLRLRYPIPPIHGEGSGVWKELNALKESYKLTEAGLNPPKVVTFEMSYTIAYDAQHTHYFTMPYAAYEALFNNPDETYSTSTSNDIGHSHYLVVGYRPALNQWRYLECDYKKFRLCFDEHPRPIFADFN